MKTEVCIPIEILTDKMSLEQFLVIAEEFTKSSNTGDDYFYVREVACAINRGFNEHGLIDSKEELLFNFMLGLSGCVENLDSNDAVIARIKTIEESKKVMVEFIDNEIKELYKLISN